MTSDHPSSGELRAETRLPDAVEELVHLLGSVRGASPASPLWEEAIVRAQALAFAAEHSDLLRVAHAARDVEHTLIALRGAEAKTQREGWLLLDQLANQTLVASSGAARRSIPVIPSRILVVDRNEQSLRRLEELARREFVHLSVAEGPEAALAIAGAGGIDCAILDIEVAAEKDLAGSLRRVAPELPLALMAENPSLDQRIFAAHSGASVFLTKPFDDTTFDAAIAQLVGLRRAEKPRILVVDDDRDFAVGIAKSLETARMSVTVLNDASRTLEVMQDRPPALVLLDVHMPDVSGTELCRVLRMIPRWQDLPIVLMTGHPDIDTRIDAFRSGATDYLVKPIVEEELLARVKARLEFARLLRERADRDPLTQLPSRRAFVEALNARLAEARRTKSRFAICMLDLDHFKAINDTHGHLSGDQVLAGFGKLLGARFRIEDLRGRWGGEEFALAFPGASGETARAVVERVLSEAREIQFTSDAGIPFRVTFSAGIACMPEDGSDASSLLRAADRRLYAAKVAGRARVMWKTESS